MNEATLVRIMLLVIIALTFKVIVAGDLQPERLRVLVSAVVFIVLVTSAYLRWIEPSGGRGRPHVVCPRCGRKHRLKSTAAGSLRCQCGEDLEWDGL